MAKVSPCCLAGAPVSDEGRMGRSGPSRNFNNNQFWTTIALGNFGEGGFWAGPGGVARRRDPCMMKSTAVCITDCFLISTVL